MEDWSAWERI